MVHDMISLVLIAYADVAELADAPDLGSGGRPCRFDSCHPHNLKVVQTHVDNGFEPLLFLPFMTNK